MNSFYPLILKDGSESLVFARICVSSPTKKRCLIYNYMKLKHIHIDKYKVFQDFDIDFHSGDKPQNLIVITGVNGNGKTTLFRDIISGTSAANKPKSTITVQDNKGIGTFTLPMISGDERYTEDFSKVRFYAADNNSSIEGLRDEILSYVDKSVYEKGKTSFEAYAEIQRLIDDIFSEFDLQIRFKGVSREKKLIFINKQEEEFGIQDLSSGEQQILSKVFVLFTDDMKGHVILIDEPESSLHPSWQTRILSVLRRCAELNDCQIIVATQSPQVIASAHKEEIRFFIRDNEGYVKAKTCDNSPYGWTVEKVLSEIQGVKYLRVPEVENRLDELKKLIRENRHESPEFKQKLTGMEQLLGFSDPDLILIRMELIRKKKKA